MDYAKELSQKFRAAAIRGTPIDSQTLLDAADLIERLSSKHKKETDPNGNDKLFDKFWEEWPLKVKKKEAKSAWRKLDLSDGLFGKIMKSVEDHKNTERWKKGYIPNPATFINGEQWEDDLSTLGPIRSITKNQSDTTVDKSFEIMRRALEGDII